MLSRTLCCVVASVAFALISARFVPVEARLWPAPVPLNESFAGIARVHIDSSVETTRPRGRFLLEQVLTVGLQAAKFAGAGSLETLCSGLTGLHLWHALGPC